MSGLLSSDLGGLDDPSHLSQVFNTFVFLITNNLMIMEDIARVFWWSGANKYNWVFKEVFKLQCPTVNVLATKLIPAAVQAGDVELVSMLLSRGVDVNVSYSRMPSVGWSNLLSMAVDCRNIHMAGLLCAKGATPTVSSFAVYNRYTESIDTLWCNHNIDLLSLLLAYHADPETFVSDEKRGFPLVHAASKGHFSAVSLLLKAGARTHWYTQEHGNALQAAAAYGHEGVVRILIEAGADVNAIPDHWHPSSTRSRERCATLLSPLELAAKCNHTRVAQMLLLSGARTNVCPSVERFGLKVLETEFARWGEPGRMMGHDMPCAYAIQYAALNEDNELMSLLLDSGADPDSRISPDLGDTPLQIAAGRGDLSMTCVLLDRGAYVNAPPGKYSGRTAIQAAAAQGNLTVVERLLEAKADINAAAGWQNGRTAMQAAIESSQVLTGLILLQMGADINAKPGFRGGITTLQAAALSGNLVSLKVTLDKKGDVNAPAAPEDGLTALHAAIQNKDLEALRLLVQAGADVNERPSKPLSSPYMNNCFRAGNKTALQYAVYLGWLDGVRFLAQNGADIDALPPFPGDDAYTALGHAIEERDPQMIELLLKCGANPNSDYIHDDDSSTAFSFALENTCSLDIIDLLLEYGPSFNNLIGMESALETAVEVGQADVVKRIMTLMSQYCPEHYTRSLKTIMSHIMIDNDWAPDFEMVRLLIDAGADTNALYICDDNTLYHGTLLQRSVRRFASGPRISVVQLLLDNGAEINTPATDNLGTPLQLAILDEEVEIANLLIDHGADVNAHPAKNRGATALQAAAMHGYCGLAMRLLAKGADVAAPAAPIDGRLAIDGAAEHGYLDMVQLLLNAYGDRPNLSFVCRRAAAAAEREGHFDVMRWLLDYIQS
ncbi:ankyrin repeat-containing protein [Aspergillus luchuensis IFO 4308]|nr:hypothetical protein ALUC_10383S [Aspergillus luchuensis]GAA86660.1 ankyrin repeat-containing protein [Aspergillus luchuensis IFO 4308]